MRRDRLTFLSSLMLVLAGCDDGSSETRDASAANDAPMVDAASIDASSLPDAASACSRGVIEADLEGPPSLPPGLYGPGVDPATGQLMPPGPEGYIVSSTYLALRPEPAAQQRFGELTTPLVPALMSNPGFVAMQLATSSSCGTARTLTVWRDEAAMLEFVTSDAHAAAMGAVSEVSRGGSAATHWIGHDVAEIDWEGAAVRVGAFEGPLY